VNIRHGGEGQRGLFLESLTYPKRKKANPGKRVGLAAVDARKGTKQFKMGGGKYDEKVQLTTWRGRSEGGCVRQGRSAVSITLVGGVEWEKDLQRRIRIENGLGFHIRTDEIYQSGRGEF